MSAALIATGLEMAMLAIRASQKANEGDLEAAKESLASTRRGFDAMSAELDKALAERNAD